MTNTSYPTIQDLNITENGIAKLLSSLNPYKAAGPDSIYNIKGAKRTFN